MEVIMVTNKDMITEGLTIMTAMVVTISLAKEATEIEMTLQRTLKH